MTAVTQTAAFNAFEDQLRTLCIQEFPCGLGKWREKKVIDKKLPRVQRQKLLLKDLPEHKFSITLRDSGPQYEKTETLEELVTAKQSIWNLDYSWSDEAKELREIAVRSPWLIDDKFVLDHFKTLRITDKGVTEVDQNLLYFSNLEELSLSANYLKCVNSRNLPSNLQVLELCANQIWSLQELCVRPPPLLHLGLGYNQLSMVDDYITGMYWPHLLSLDLSHNNLSDLMDIVKKLTTLPKLRNLILQGNPLAFVAGYRGYTIDSLRQLDVLDDVSISADECHHFKGLAKRREYILDEAKLFFNVDFIRGVPMPEEIRNPDEQPEFPIISRKYYVQFMFLEDKSTPAADMLQMLQQQQHHDDDLSCTTPSNLPPPGGAGAEFGLTEVGSTAAMSRLEEIPSNASSSGQEKNVNFAQTLETLPSTTMPVSGSGSRLESEAGGGREESVYEAAEMQHHAQSLASTPIKLVPIKSTAVEWSEDMEIQWTETVSRDDLVHVRDFFKMGMDIMVMEEKIESFPAPEKEETPSPTGSKSGGKGGKGGKGKGEPDKKKSKSDEKSARSKTPEKKGGKGLKNKVDPKKSDGKKNSKADNKGKVAAKDGGKDKKKKKGEPEIELTHMPPEYTTLATFHVPFDDFLNGDFDFENVFSKASVDSGNSTPASDTAISKKDKKDKDKDKKKKPDSGKKDKKDQGKSPKNSAKGKKGEKDAGKSPKTEKKGDKGGKDKKASTTNAEGDDEPPPPPPPLECHVKIHLHHWKTAMDSLRDEKQAAGDRSEGTERK